MSLHIISVTIIYIFFHRLMSHHILIMFWLLIFHASPVSSFALQPDSIQIDVDLSPAIDKNVLIIGTAKNAATHLPEVLDHIDHIGAQFKQYSTLFFTDTNDDQTEEILTQYSNQFPKTRKLIVDHSNTGIRTEKIAYARNQLMQTAYQLGLLDSHEIVIQVDMDDVMTGPQVDVSNLKQAINHLNQYDVICTNNRGFYYDRWALRTSQNNKNCIKNSSCELDLSHWFGPAYLGQNSISAHNDLIPVQSCFGGLAIYKSSILSTCLKSATCQYQGRDNGFFHKKDCEHVFFHAALKKTAAARIAIDPQLQIGHPFQVASHSRNFTIPYYFSDKTFPAYADYVFNTYKKNSNKYLHHLSNIYGQFRPTSWTGLKTIFVQTNDLPLFQSSWLPKISSPFILITGGDVLSVPSDLNKIKPKHFFNKIRSKGFNPHLLLDNPYLIAWYTQNYDHTIQHKKLRAIPLGMGYRAHENKDLHGETKKSAFEQDQQLQKVVADLLPTYSRKFKIFSDTHLNNTSSRHQANGIEPRESVYHTVKDNPLIEFQEKPLPRSTQWAKRGTYMFSLSLIGNGFDCHRTIESLILGNIVLLQSSPIDPLFEGLPVVIIKDWRDINEENLHLWALQYEDALTNPRYREKLTSDYWINKVISESTSKIATESSE